MDKITKESVNEVLVKKHGWTKEYELNTIEYYRSPCKRYTLQESPYCNLFDPLTETGWNLHIDNSDMMSLASCDVEFIHQINALIEIYKNY